MTPGSDFIWMDQVHLCGAGGSHQQTPFGHFTQFGDEFVEFRILIENDVGFIHWRNEDTFCWGRQIIIRCDAPIVGMYDKCGQYCGDLEVFCCCVFPFKMGSICIEDRGTHQMVSISNLFQTMALGKLNDSFTASVVSTHNYLSCIIAGLNYLYSHNIPLFEYHFHLHTFAKYT